MASGWREQYDRMKRWHERFAQIDQGYKHDRPSEHSVDDIYAFFQNCFHLKDWIKNDHTLPNNVRDSVEPFINGSRSLGLCADLCNSLKHLERESNRSGEDPAFGPKAYSLSLAEGSISIKCSITTDSGQEDAFALATQCVYDWDAFIARWDL
jgi:hypothetical protein